VVDHVIVTMCCLSFRLAGWLENSKTNFTRKAGDMKKGFRILYSLLLMAVLAACSSVPASTTTAATTATTAAQQGPLPGLSRDALGSYSSIFEIQFSGSTQWVYQLRTRKSAALREENLVIQGVDPSQNPGDVRMVTDQVTTWMIGPGTDNQCVQFPNGQGMDPSMIYPDTLLSVADMSRLLTLAGEEQVGNKTALHFSGAGLAVNGWQDARVDVWQEKTSQALLRFTMQATGEDIFFGTGTGTLQARYEVSSFEEPTIEPVAGCEVGVPLPETATLLVRLPGMASFETIDPMDAVAAFYQSALPPQGWTASEPPAQSETSIVLSYTRGAENLEIHAESTAEGSSKVKLIFLNAQ